MTSLMRSVFVAGMARAGSMWTFNVTRALLEAAGYEPYPAVQPIYPHELRALVAAAFDAQPQGRRVYCLKVHEALNAVPENVRIVCNFRDVRPALLSFMRFMHYDFEAALPAAREMAAVTDHYLRLKENGTGVLLLTYAAVTGHPEGVLRSLASHMGLTLPEQTFSDVLERFSKERIRARLEKLGEVKLDAQGRIADPEAAKVLQSIPNPDGSFRLYDNATGFQSHHITSQEGEDWRAAFTPEQLERLDAEFAPWLTRHGLPV